MILIDHTVISDDVADQFFVCNLDKCKGACCVEGDLGAPLEPDELEKLREVYAIYDDRGILKCGIEAAYNDGKVNWKKPISCHLYPIRVTKYDGYHALNYDRWPICKPACGFGKELNVPVYKFVREALVRAYGQAWYDKLVREIESEED